MQHRSALSTCRLAFAVLVVFAIAFVARADSFASGTIEIETGTPLPSGQYTYGTAVVPVAITNTAEQSRTVELVYEGSSDNWVSVHIRRMTHTVEVAAGETARVSLVVPNAAMDWGRVSVMIDGSRQRNELGFTPASGRARGENVSWASGSGADGTMQMLVSGRTPRDFADILDRVTDYSTNSLRYEVEVSRSDTGIAGWPRDPRALSRYGMVIIDREEFRGASGSEQQAVRDYLFAGGALVLLGEDSLPEDVLETRDPALLMDQQLIIEQETVSEGVGIAGYGFGVLLTIDPLRVGVTGIENALESVLDRRSPVPRWVDSSPESVTDSERSFPVAPAARVPAGAMFIVLLLFVIVIGPVNVLLLSRWKQRTLLFVTVPAGGVLCSLVIFAIGFLGQGVTPTVRSASVVLRAQARGRAVTRSHVAIHAPLAPGGGARFDADEHVTFMKRSRDWYSRESTPLSIDLADGFRVSNGLVQSGVPSHVLVDSVRTRRERLEFSASDSGEGTPSVVNGLGADILELVYCDPDGKRWSVRALEAGQRASLSESSRSGSAIASHESAGWRANTFAPLRLINLRNRDEPVARIPSSVRVPRNGYLALLEGAPFVRVDVSGSSEEYSATLVIGLLEDGSRVGPVSMGGFDESRD